MCDIAFIQQFNNNKKNDNSTYIYMQPNNWIDGSILNNLLDLIKLDLI